MTRVELIREVQRYFAQELVDELTYKKYGDFAWNFFRTELLETLLVLRDKIVKKPMTINDWMYGKSWSQRGLRTNLSELIQAKTKQNKLSMSAHSTGAGVDFNVAGMTPSEVRQLIQTKANLLPYPIRLEDDASAPTWVHIDVYNDGSKGKVVTFKV